MTSPTAYTVADLADPELPATLPLWPDVAGILGIARNRAYELAEAGGLPVPAWKLGSRWVVPTGHLRRALGIAAETAGDPVPRSAAGTDLATVLDGAYVLVPVEHLRRALGLDAADGATPPGVLATDHAPLRDTA